MQQRKGLGRGIASLIPTFISEKVEPSLSPVGSSEKKENYRLIPVGAIVPNSLQPRKYFDEQKIQELAASIREKGVLVPLLVSQRAENPDHYELISGERRFRASQLAGLKEVPVLVRNTVPAERLEIAIIENVQRADLDPIEEAVAYQELMDQFGYTQEVVSQKMGKDRATVGNILRLLKLPLKVKQALQSSQITMGHARALLSVSDLERQLYFLKRIVEEGWSVRELEMRIASRRIMGSKKRIRDVSALPLTLMKILDDLRRKLGTQVRLVPTGKKGKIVIEYYSEEDLNRLYHTLVT